MQHNKLHMPTTNTDAPSTTEPSKTQPRRVCIQGEPGAFHDIAARHCFQGEELDIIPANTFSDLVNRMESDQEVDTAMMAIENTLAGSLLANYQLLNESSLHVVGEVYLRIRQNLMALPGQEVSELKEVHSHPMAIAQCRDYFRAHPKIRLVEAEDTAGSARMVREENLLGIGAIASTLAADLYGLNILAPAIETNKANYTRFLVLDRERNPGVCEKVSVCFSTDHQVGSLYKVLAVLAAYNINLSKIQSMPIIGKPWEYLFFVDFHVSGTVGYEQAMEAIRPLTHYLRVLGAYAKGDHFEY